jgi:hypothetical protein
MSNETIELFGDEKLKWIFEHAPKAFKDAMLRWFRAERRFFVGDKFKDGKFRQRLLNKQLSGRPGQWSEKTARLFRGYIDHRNVIDKMELRMGVGLKQRFNFARNLAAMETGYTSAPHGQWMPLPVYDNLAKIGVTKAFKSEFRKLYDKSALDPAMVNGQMMFFDDSGIKGRGHTLLFIGARNITVRPQFSFKRDWSARLPGIPQRGEKQMQRAIDRMTKGNTRVE